MFFNKKNKAVKREKTQEEVEFEQFINTVSEPLNHGMKNIGILIGIGGILLIVIIGLFWGVDNKKKIPRTDQEIYNGIIDAGYKIYGGTVVDKHRNTSLFDDRCYIKVKTDNGNIEEYRIYTGNQIYDDGILTEQVVNNADNSEQATYNKYQQGKKYKFIVKDGIKVLGDIKPTAKIEQK